MKCPKCNGEQHCPCPACVERHKQKVTWKWVAPDGPIACGHCGHVMGEWEWMKTEMEEYENKSNASRLNTKQEKLKADI